MIGPSSLDLNVVGSSYSLNQLHKGQGDYFPTLCNSRQKVKNEARDVFISNRKTNIALLEFALSIVTMP